MSDLNEEYRARQSLIFKLNNYLRIAGKDEVVYRRFNVYSGKKRNELKELLKDGEGIGIWQEMQAPIPHQAYRKHTAYIFSRLEEAISAHIIGDCPPFLLRVYRKEEL